MAEMDKISESQRMDKVDAQGNWQYPSTAGTGHDEIELPSLPGTPNAVERLHVRDFGVHVIGAIDRSMARQGYMKSGPRQGPVEVFAHYAAVAEGTSLLTKDGLMRMKELSKEFAAEAYREEFYSMVVKPWLLSLSPRRR